MTPLLFGCERPDGTPAKRCRTALSKRSAAHGRRRGVCGHPGDSRGAKGCVPGSIRSVDTRDCADDRPDPSSGGVSHVCAVRCERMPAPPRRSLQSRHPPGSAGAAGCNQCPSLHGAARLHVVAAGRRRGVHTLPAGGYAHVRRWPAARGGGHTTGAAAIGFSSADALKKRIPTGTSHGRLRSYRKGLAFGRAAEPRVS